ncbi:MAG TPA: DUF4282 domain-containing protein [Blastocatellia bacterium]
MSSQPPYGNPQGGYPGGYQGGGYQGGGYPPSSYQPSSSSFSDFLTFRKMITPIIIQIIFWLGVAGVVITGLLSIVAGLSAYNGGFFIFVGFLYMVLGPIVVRIYCELLIVAFRMNETLTDIKNALERRP